MLGRNENEFDKKDLRNELEQAGFENHVADYIADRVDERKGRGWNNTIARQEAIREAELMINSSKAALDNFKEKTEATTTTAEDMEQKTRTVLKA